MFTHIGTVILFLNGMDEKALILSPDTWCGSLPVALWSCQGAVVAMLCGARFQRKASGWTGAVHGDRVLPDYHKGKGCVSQVNSVRLHLQ